MGGLNFENFRRSDPLYDVIMRPPKVICGRGDNRTLYGIYGLDLQGHANIDLLSQTFLLGLITLRT